MSLLRPLGAFLGSLFFALVIACGSACGPRLPDEVADFYLTMEHSAWGFPRMDGAWSEHYGDAPYYGPAFYVRGEPGHPGHAEMAHLAVAAAAARHNVETLRRAQADRTFFLENLEEVMMSAFGLIEYSAATGDRTGKEELEDSIATIDALVIGLRHYVDVEAGMFAIRTYGPTAITAAVALLNMQYVMLLGEDDPALAAERLDLVKEIVAAIDARAWDGSRYLVRPGDGLLELYPNTMMALVLCRLYEKTGEPAYLARAEAAFAALLPLRSARGGYNSPYSAKEMGATTDDYTTLSSQNYLTLALALLYRATGDRRYFDEALYVIDFVRSRLYDPATGRLLHHFMDGRIALPADPEYFCTGCNLQFLYVVRYLKDVL